MVEAVMLWNEPNNLSHWDFELDPGWQVFARMAILASLLLPALTKSKTKAEGIACANNIKQLSVAWLLYADDNADLFVNNHGVPETLSRRPAVRRLQRWPANLPGSCAEPAAADRLP